MEDDEEKKTLKGISKTVTKKNVSFDEYKTALFKHEVISKEVRAIRSFGCVNHSIIQTKKALSCYDDKRYILDDGVESLAYGHYKIRG